MFQRIVRVLELAGLVMDELANSTGPRTEVLAGHCREFMKSIKVFLREYLCVSEALGMLICPRWELLCSNGGD
ncbi:Mediator of RNA polymerase II transcription subunit 11 [Dendrobium catenatum]|uniref:Mediator of RNA polymerase II transcription subunit 11 n=1 Tax=Dendrobium catenatum TaxID=906689 RepID=A0A2I0V6X0_9ASPA|nr:Mediator of RNA polymerase II transcription subunit 11 [Dendrobium catenatum]